MALQAAQKVKLRKSRIASPQSWFLTNPNPLNHPQILTDELAKEQTGLYSVSEGMTYKWL